MVSALLLSASAAYAVPITFTAILDGPSESPPNASPATGFATVIFDIAAHTMSVDVSFSGLLGTTTASHIHCCTAAPNTGTAGVATTTPTFAGFPLGVTSGIYSNTLDMTLASSYNPAFVTAHGGSIAMAEADLLAAMLNDQTYLNIHTTFRPGGEIRGFLHEVPEPTTLLLLGTGLSAAALRSRKRRS
jgi:hypothetical protein